MNVLDKWNEEWNMYFKNNRTQFLYDLRPEFLDFLENLELVCLVKPEPYLNSFGATFSYNGKHILFLLNAEYPIYDNTKGIYFFKNELEWFEKTVNSLKITSYIEIYRIQEEERIFNEAKKGIGLKVKDIKKEDGKMIYILEDGTEIKSQLEF
jgi:hypothetical protein